MKKNKNPRTGSYTIHVPKDARTGKFRTTKTTLGKIIFPKKK